MHFDSSTHCKFHSKSLRFTKNFSTRKMTLHNPASKLRKKYQKLHRGKSRDCNLKSHYHIDLELMLAAQPNGVNSTKL